MLRNFFSSTPFGQLVYLFLLIASGLITSVFLTSIIAELVMGISISENPDALLENMTLLRVSQILQVCFMMFVPSLIFIKRYGTEEDFKIFNKPEPKSLLILAALAIVVSQPFIEWTALFNHQLKLPTSLSGIESWMISNEEQMSQLTFNLLSTKHWPTIVMNVAMMVILPAFCEELLFRGVLQTKFTQWLNNGHLAVILTAFLFSAIHMQFLTFLPRFILGASLGYMLLWGKSIWLPIMGHFANNALALIIFYYYQVYQPDINPLEATSENTSSPIMYILSTVLFAAIVYLIKWIKDNRLKLIP